MTDEDIIEFARQFREGILDGREPHGRCFMVCAPMVTLLNMYGVKCEMVEGPVTVSTEFDNHVWLELADGRVLDPTADQFNGSQRPALPPVYLGPPTAFHRRSRKPPPWSGQRARTKDQYGGKRRPRRGPGSSSG